MLNIIYLCRKRLVSFLLMMEVLSHLSFFKHNNLLFECYDKRMKNVFINEVIYVHVCIFVF